MVKYSYQKFFCIIIFLFFFGLYPASAICGNKISAPKNDPLLAAMQTELKRAMKDLKLPEQPTPYFISFFVQESASVSISGRYGAITSSYPKFYPYRTAGVQVRVGDYKFDNTNLPFNKRFGPEDAEELMEAGDWRLYQVPIEGGEASLRAALWIMCDMAYKRAIGDYQKKKVFKATSVDTEESKLDDFYRDTGHISIEDMQEIAIDSKLWEDIIRSATGYLARKTEIMDPAMDFRSDKIVYYYINSEGTVIRASDVYYSVNISAWTRASDGMKVNSFRHYFVRDVKDLPDMKGFMKEAAALEKELSDLRTAEEFKPYTGPAILGPDVAGVFFHEALGHRLEGERQRMPDSGYTFKGKIGEKILPDFLSIIDDPTLATFKGKTLTGYYTYDDEGVAAEKVILVKKGILENYLLSRTPVKGFDKSNGHGRVQGPPWGFFGTTIGRMANLIVDSNKKLGWDDLKSKLIEEARKQGKPYGLIIRRVKGGETNTQASQGFFGGSFQAFKATPVLVYSVDVETGKEKLVRGVELVGTPLVSLEKIIATGDDEDVFNGTCGAESGQIPVSVVSPSILTSQVELQRIGGSPKRLPILPSPFKEK